MNLDTAFAPATEAELAELVAARFRDRAPLRILGGGTRSQTGHLPGAELGLSRLSGVVTYVPGEMTLIARAGTPLDEINALLATEGQALAFEPPDMRGALGGAGRSTIGGVVAANASGPRRLLAGACRDHLLGVRFVDGQGRVLKNGGRVMKNVTGLDLVKLLCGAHGTLGVLTEVVLKTLPVLPERATLAFRDVTAADAAGIFRTALATPYEVSGAAFHDGTAWLRIEGLGPQLAYRQGRLLALFPDRLVERMDADATVALWRDLRDVTRFKGAEAPLWRLLVKPTEAPRIVAALEETGGATLMDWGGGLIWYCGSATPQVVRAIAPHATLIRRGGLAGPVFALQSPPVSALQSRLRQAFDPAGILNPGLMEG